MIFGVLYGLGNVGLYQLLHRTGTPEFYDKLLPVPILNVMIQLIDRAARSERLRWLDPTAMGRSLVGRRRNLAYMAIWAIVFTVMSAAGGVGDKHPGQFVPFWQQACRADRLNACTYLATLYSNFCNQGSDWGCNELEILQIKGDSVRAPAVAPPTLADYPIILRGSKAPITDQTPAALYALACNQGWPGTCDNVKR
jgi:hypothetical protein